MPPKPRKTAPTAQNYDPFFDPETGPEALGDIALDGFDLGAALGIDPEPEASAPGPEVQGGIKVSNRMGARQIYRKAASEAALEKAINWHFREGDCYHCFSFGDVDSFSFFKMVLRQQPITYAAISTWCMAGEDVFSLRGLVLTFALLSMRQSKRSPSMAITLLWLRNVTRRPPHSSMNSMTAA